MEPQGLNAAWKAAEAALPTGWKLDGLRCGSTGLSPEHRSEDWVAVAVAPDGTERSVQAADPFAALEALAALAASLASGPR
jgi:hypothetical protein